MINLFIVKVSGIWYHWWDEFLEQTTGKSVCISSRNCKNEKADEYDLFCYKDDKDITQI
jgi:hypothetical protein